jgi:hypothetical protein
MTRHNIAWPPISASALQLAPAALATGSSDERSPASTIAEYLGVLEGMFIVEVVSVSEALTGVVGGGRAATP